MPSVKLSSKVTVDDYHRMLNKMDKDAIANLVVSRFTERYLDPIESGTDTKSGFTIMAVCCLMIEAMESFLQGLESSDGKSKKMFSSFFARENEFATFSLVSAAFYKHIRCGILHQAETTGGWLIHRKGPLHGQNKINATAFAKALRKCLNTYADKLRSGPWESVEWDNLRKKMEFICKNTEAP